MRVELFEQTVRLAHPIEAAGQRHEQRNRLFLAIHSDGLTGWGEVNPQPSALNGDPGLGEVLSELLTVTLPQLTRWYESLGNVPDWQKIGLVLAPRPSSHVANALVEMALFDLALQASQTSLEAFWPQRFSTPLQQTVSALDDTEWRVIEQVGRLRVKVSSGGLSTVALHQLRGVSCPVLLDYNACGVTLEEIRQHLVALKDVCDVVAIEQPFAPGNVVDHALVRRELGVALSIDEGIRSVRDVRQILRYGAADIVCVKPNRVGGLAAARSLTEYAREEGLRPYVGGFFEGTLARTVNRIFARHLTNEPSDIGAVEVFGPGGDFEEVSHEGIGWRPRPSFYASARTITL